MDTNRLTSEPTQVIEKHHHYPTDVTPPYEHPPEPPNLDPFDANSSFDVGAPNATAIEGEDTTQLCHHHGG